MKRYDLLQGSTEWHAFRLKHLGASESGTGMGCGYSTPYKLWCQKVGLGEPEPENDAMRRGKALEPEALELFNKLRGKEFAPAVYESELYPFMSASMDGVFLIEGIVHEAVEIKACGERMHAQLMEGHVPFYMEAQIQHQLSVLELPRMYLFAYSPESHKIIEVERDEEFILKMIEAEKEFWDCVTLFKPPELTDADWEDMEKDAEWYSLSAKWKDAKKRLKIAEDIEEDYRNGLIEMSEGKNCRGNNVQLTKYLRKGNIQYDRIDALKGVNLEPYRKPPIESFRISIKGEEE